MFALEPILACLGGRLVLWDECHVIGWFRVSDLGCFSLPSADSDGTCSVDMKQFLDGSAVSRRVVIIRLEWALWAARCFPSCPSEVWWLHGGELDSMERWWLAFLRVEEREITVICNVFSSYGNFRWTGYWTIQVSGKVRAERISVLP